MLSHLTLILAFDFRVVKGRGGHVCLGEFSHSQGDSALGAFAHHSAAFRVEVC